MLNDGWPAVSYSNPNLTLDDLKYIYGQFIAANNLYEWELMMQGVAMPWLKRGTKLQITAIPLEGGLLLTPPPMLITEVKTAFDGGRSGSLTTPTVRLFGWSPGP